MGRRGKLIVQEGQEKRLFDMTTKEVITEIISAIAFFAMLGATVAAMFLCD